MNAYSAMAIVTAACLTILLILSRGIWNLGHSVANGLERSAVWLHRVCNAGEYSAMAFRYKLDQQRTEDEA